MPNRVFISDIDGVLADFQTAFDEFIPEVFGKEVVALNKNVSELAARYEITPGELQHAMNEFVTRHGFMRCNKLPGAEKVAVLKPMIVTARPEAAKKDTVMWLLQNGIRFSNIQFEQDKKYFADPKYIIAYFEDHPGHAMDYAKRGVKVYLFDQPYNRNISHPNITRVSGWADINIGKLADYLE